jgi:hypothetical protein
MQPLHLEIVNLRRLHLTLAAESLPIANALTATAPIASAPAAIALSTP